MFGSEMTISFSCERPMVHGPRPSSGKFPSFVTISTTSRASPCLWASSGEMAEVPWSFASPPTSSVRKMRVWPEVSWGASFSRGPSPPVSLAVMPNSPKRKESSVSKRTLGGPDGLHVLFGEVHGEVVGGVGARDADHPALVHLLGEGLGDLHRVDLSPESAPEDALDERFHPLLNVFEDAQRKLPSRPHNEVPQHRVHYSRESERNHSVGERLRTFGDNQGVR